MKIDTTIVNKLAETIAESSPIADQSAFSQKAIAHALSRAFDRFAHEYPVLRSVINNSYGSDFIASELSKLITGEEQPDPNHIRIIWEEMLLQESGRHTLSIKELSELYDLANVFLGYISEELARAAITTVTFNLVDITESETPELTLDYFASVVHPYIQSIAELQRLIDQIKKLPSGIVAIKSVQQHSPVSVSLDGASDAIKLIKETIVPWRRKHAETMAHLLEQEKLAEIELKKAEVLEKRAIAAKERKLTDKLKVENEKLRAETSLQQAKVQLATEIVLAISTNLNETEKEKYITELLPVLDVLALGRLEMVIKK